MTGLYELSRKLSGALSLEDTLAILANRLSGLIPHTTCSIVLVDERTRELEIVYASGRNSEKLLGRRCLPDSGTTGWVVSNRKAIFNVNPLLDTAMLGQSASEYVGAMIFPLFRNETAIGAIALYSSEIPRYGKDQIQLLESISIAASDAVSSAVSFQAARQAVQSTEHKLKTVSLKTFRRTFSERRTERPLQGQTCSLCVIKVVGDAGLADTKDVESELLTLLSRGIDVPGVAARAPEHTVLVLLSDTDAKTSRSVGTGILELVFSSEIVSTGSVSIGVATANPGDDDLDELIATAQANQIVRYEHHEDTGPLVGLSDLAVS